MADAFLLNLDGADLRTSRPMHADACSGSTPNPTSANNFAKLALGHRSAGNTGTTTMVRASAAYPWQRESFGFVKSSRAEARATGGRIFENECAALGSRSNGRDVHELLGARIDAAHSLWRNELTAPPRLSHDHRVQGTTLLPGSHWWSWGLQSSRYDRCSTALLQDLQFHKALVVAEQAPLSIQDLRRAAR